MKPSVADRLKSRLEEFTQDLESNVDILHKYTHRTVRVIVGPKKYQPATVKQTRRLLKASQRIFASFLGVSPKTLQAWEQGVTQPPPIARRFMDEIRHDPGYWTKRLEATVLGQ